MAGRKQKDTSLADLANEPLNDYTSAPDAVSMKNEDLRSTVGSTTGETENAPTPGGWDGTDDATSTAPSDLSQLPSADEGLAPEERLHIVEKERVNR